MPDPPQPPHFRAATDADLDRLVEIHLRAFPDARGVAERLRNFEHNAFGPLSRLVVAEQGNALVGHAFLFDFELGCRGTLLPIAGVASVGIAPEARGKGVGTALMHHLHDLARARGKVATALFPFREGFYARLGYGKTSPSLHLECAPAALKGLRGTCPVRAAVGPDRDRIISLHDRLTQSGLGRIRRSDATWNKLFLNERRYLLVAERGDELVGFTAVIFEQEEAHGRVTLRVQDFLASDYDAERSLLAALGNQRDQVYRAWLEVPYGSHLPETLVDIDALRPGTRNWEHPVGKLTTGAMVRVLDFSALLALLPLERNGTLALHVKDEDATYTVAMKDGERSVAKLAGRNPDALSTSAAGASSLLVGGISAISLSAAGQAEGTDEALLRASEFVGSAPFFGCDAF